MELSSEIHKKDNKVVRKPMKITIVKKKGSGKHSLCSNSVSLSFRSRINNLTQVKNTSTAQNNQTQHKRSHSFNQQTPYSQSQIQSPNKVGPTNGLNILGRDRSKAKANWTITNLHPPPPIMPSFTQSTGSSTAASLISILNKSGGGGAALTYEEDALILRVIESYSAAYQSNSRNTMHADLENDDHPPTLKQIWQTVKLMQKDIKQMKVIVAEERALRCNLQELLMTYLEKGSNHKTTGC
uniref:CSON014074 protein n=1 Tax=Culicoides sonorensis TaxID=179676 RepID=A0A336KQ62_CULSO